MDVLVNRYFIIFSSYSLLPESLSNLTGELSLTVDTASSAEALTKLVEKKMPAAIFLIQDQGNDPIEVLNQLRTNTNVDTVPIFAVNSLQHACKRMLEFVELNM